MAKLEHFPLTGRLHTDVLEERYGPIHVDILRHDARVREAHLEDERGVSRTYALTFFPEQLPPEFRPIDRTIGNGQAIGKAFREAGYLVRKNVVAVFKLRLPPLLRRAFRVRATSAKARLSEFYARNRVGRPLLYGTVLEVYSPDFRPARLNATDYAQVNAPTDVLRRHGFTEEEIWRRLGDDNYWDDVRAQHAAAKLAARRAVDALKQRAKDYINRRR